MSFKPCLKCGVVIEEDLAEVSCYKLNGEEPNNYGVRVFGFKCNSCGCVTLTNTEDLFWFNDEELKKEFGEWKK